MYKVQQSFTYRLMKTLDLLVLGTQQFFSSNSAMTYPNPGKMTVNGIDMYYEMHGSGTPIILIAGFSCDHSFWTGILDQLAAHHTVLLFDNRGIGQTDSPNAPYSIETMAEDAMELSKNLGLHNPIVIGQSMGTAIAQTMAKRYGNQIKKLVLLNTFDHISKAPAMAFELTAELQRMGLPMRYLVQSIAPWVFSSEFLSQPNQLEKLIKLAEDNPYPQSLIGYERQLDALKGFDSTKLHNIKTPALIIAGEEDIIAPLQGAKDVQARLGNNTRLEIIPGGHASPIEQPKKVAELILQFID